MKRLLSHCSTLLCALALLLPTAAFAKCSDGDSVLADLCDHVSKLWEEGGNDLYVPMYTYHMRYAWSSEEIARFNELPLGLGYGRSRTQGDHWEGVYGMVFLDSNNKAEPLVGYAYQWLWGAPDSLRAGLGYTVLVTARDDIYHYIPIPGILPIGSLQYGKVSLNTTYVPGGRGFGNILFFWSRVEF